MEQIFLYKAVRRGNQWAVVRYEQLAFGACGETISYFQDKMEALQVADAMNKNQSIAPTL